MNCQVSEEATGPRLKTDVEGVGGREVRSLWLARRGGY